MTWYTKFYHSDIRIYITHSKMIEIDNKIVSLDLLRECFSCDLGLCKGICCVEGDSGAPLDIDEVDTCGLQGDQTSQS